MIAEDVSVRIKELSAELVAALGDLEEEERLETLNRIRADLHSVSPMKDHPVDLVLWVPAESVESNAYNPNVVAPPEFRLLEHSIDSDGYTQPVVSWERPASQGGGREIVDGYHRGLVCKNSESVQSKTKGYLPVTTLGENRTSENDRKASTIRHNRARGVHQVEAMSEIVRDLTLRNWSEKRIAKELGMEPDEVLRLKQITGLRALFADEEFSEAWEIE